MKITRSTKCSLKDTSTKKKELLQHVLSEYGRVVNIFINYFWSNGSVSKAELLKPIVDLPSDSWLSARLRKVAAREALDMITSVKEVHQSNKDQLELTIKSLKTKIKSIKPDSKENRRRLNRLSCKLRDKTNRFEMFQPTKPCHTGNRMNVSCTIADLQESKSKEFDAWLHLTCIGNKIKLDLPIRFHDHYNRLASKGKRLNAYIITEKYVQFCFEIDTGEKKEVKKLLGIDTGINALASTSNGQQFGTDVKTLISKCKRKKWGSKGHRRASNALRQRINEVAKEIVLSTDLVVVEKLKNMNNNSKLKGRLSRNIRSSIGSWNYSHWLERIQLNCEMNRVSFRSVSPYYTSQTCPTCGHVDRKNRDGELFQCQECDQTGNADCIAAWNILMRFILGTYGSQYKSLVSDKYATCSYL
jgi:IS605 OrfB family transposase